MESNRNMKNNAWNGVCGNLNRENTNHPMGVLLCPSPLYKNTNVKPYLIETPIHAPVHWVQLTAQSDSPQSVIHVPA